MSWKTIEHYNGPLPLLALVYAHAKGKHLLPQLPALQHYEVEALEKLEDDLKRNTNTFIIYMKDYIEMKSTYDLEIDGVNVNNCLVNRDGGDPMISDIPNAVDEQFNVEPEVTGNVVNQNRDDVKMKINEIGKLLDEVVQLVNDSCYNYNEDDGMKDKVFGWGSLVDHLKSKMFYNSTNNTDVDEDGFTSTMWCEADKTARHIESIFLGGKTMNSRQFTILNVGCEQPNFDLGITQLTPSFHSITMETPATTKPQGNSKLDKVSASSVGLSIKKTLECVITPGVAISTVKPIVEAIKREPRLIKLPAILRSPFVRKKVSLVMKKSTVEVNLGTTVFAANKNPRDLLFESETWAIVPTVSFETLHPDVIVHVSVIQAWTSVLNSEDKFRNKSDPPRLFCPPNMLFAEDFGEDVEVIRKITTFNNKMDIVLKDVGLDTLVGIELVFIPMLHSDHYYLMCFNLRKAQVDVIDNYGTSMLFDSKYETKPQIMQEIMCLYLTMTSHPIANALRNCTPTRLSMPWRTLTNTVDRGIFMMRQMETYKGTSINAWKCGLTVESEAQKSQLTDLRVKYVAKILLSDINKHKEFVVSKVRDYVKLPTEERAINRNNSVERIMERVRMC